MGGGGGGCEKPRVIGGNLSRTELTKTELSVQSDAFPTVNDTSHLLSATVRVYSLVAPCCLPDLTSLALLGSVSGQRGLSRGPLPGYKTVSKWRLQLQDSTPFLLLSQRFCTILHTSASLGCYLLFTHMPDCPLAPLGQV